MNLETVFEEGTLRLWLDGELDHHAAKKAMTAIQEHIDAFLPRRCVMDMRDVRFMDSSGIAVLVKTRRRMEEIDGRLTVENVRGQPLRVLRAAGVDRLINITARAVGEV
jgi:stage II sporulation protein AA (anti-sigma F factor antagonist)